MTKTNNYYIDNDALLEEVLSYKDKLNKSLQKFKDEGIEPSREYKFGLYLMSSDLAKMIMLLVKNIANSSQFRNKEYRDDMESSVLIDVLKAVKSFSLEFSEKNKGKYPNPYGYLTRCTILAMIKYCDKENENLSKRLDYIIDSVDDNFDLDYDAIYKENISELKVIRQNVVGKWSQENMLKRKNAEKKK